jgi:hypothetical protein
LKKEKQPNVNVNKWSLSSYVTHFGLLIFGFFCKVKYEPKCVAPNYSIVNLFYFIHIRFSSYFCQCKMKEENMQATAHTVCERAAAGHRFRWSGGD